MESWALILLIVLVLGIVIGNLMLLKHSANMKLPADVLRSIEKREKEKRLNESDKSQ